MNNILLIEDDLSLVNGLTFALKKQGFKLEVARTLKEAENLWTDGKYDLLVLDVALPDGTGFEFCKKVRRTNDFSTEGTMLQSNGIKVFLLQGQAFKNDRLLELTAAEYKLLCLFMRNPNVVLTKEQILDRLWDCNGNYIDSSTLTVYMRRLRIKIEDNPGEPKMLLTVRGMGYKWNVID